MGDLAHHLRKLIRDQQKQEDLELRQQETKNLEQEHFIESKKSKEKESIIEWNGCPQKTEAVGDAGAGSDTAREPTGAKSKANNNEFSFSGLLHIHSGVDDWFEVIDVMTKAFYIKNNAMPTKAQAWAELCTNTPTGYGIKSNINQSLIMPGITKEFNKRSFDRRWTKRNRRC